MSYSRNIQHVIFSTKHRRAWLNADIRPDLYAMMGGITRHLKSILIGAGGVEDHVHLRVNLHSTSCVADLVRDVKSGSSRWIHERFPDMKDFAWQTKYGCFSVSRSIEEAVAAYIRNQEEHHRKETFQEEFRAFLTRHGIEYDERYIWE